MTVAYRPLSFAFNDRKKTLFVSQFSRTFRGNLMLINLNRIYLREFGKPLLDIV